MNKEELIMQQRADLLWAKVADVWLPYIDEIMEKGFNQNDEDHQKCLSVMLNLIKGELHMKGLHP